MYDVCMMYDPYNVRTGRVFDALGEVIDEKEDLLDYEVEYVRLLQSASPSIVSRAHERVHNRIIHSGCTLIDMLHPINMGGRFGIYGEKYNHHVTHTHTHHTHITHTSHTSRITYTSHTHHTHHTSHTHHAHITHITSHTHTHTHTHTHHTHTHMCSCN